MVKKSVSFLLVIVAVCGLATFVNAGEIQQTIVSAHVQGMDQVRIINPKAEFAAPRAWTDEDVLNLYQELKSSGYFAEYPFSWEQIQCIADNKIDVPTDYLTPEVLTVAVVGHSGEFNLAPYGLEWGSQSGTYTTKASCSWDGVSYYDVAYTRSKNFDFQGHRAAYFVVPADAQCYQKNCSVGTWTPTSGHLSDWYLLLEGDPFTLGGKRVKRVALLISSLWWDWIQFPRSSDEKASLFWLAWDNQRNTCCQ